MDKKYEKIIFELQVKLINCQKSLSCSLRIFSKSFAVEN